MPFEPHSPPFASQVRPKLMPAEFDRTQVALQEVTALVETSSLGNAAPALPYVAPTGADQASAIQAKLDAAGPDDVVRLYGTYTTSTTLVVSGNLDATGAVINYTGTGIAVQVGHSTGLAVTVPKRVILPRVIKSGSTWVAGTVGVKITNFNVSQIWVPAVNGFETGLLMFGEQGKGSSYNTIYLGWLQDNKVNHRNDVLDTGWVTQNTFIGGRYFHPSSRGVNATGTKQVHIAAPFCAGNVWINSSFEGDVPEYLIDSNGHNDLFWNCRYEVSANTGKVIWRAAAYGNELTRGAQLETVVFTHTAGSYANQVQTRMFKQLSASGDPGVLVQNTSGGSALMTFVDAGTIEAGTDTTTGYTSRFTNTDWNGKRAADAFPRVKIDGLNGRLYVGDGTANPTVYWSGSSTSMKLGGTSPLIAATDDTLDIGKATGNRFRNLFLSGYLGLAGNGGPKLLAGTGDPTGVVAAPAGSIWMRSDGGAASTQYIKETGTGTAGWAVVPNAQPPTLNGISDLPTGALAQTYERRQRMTAVTLTSGQMALSAIWLTAGMTVTSITFSSGSTVLAGGTHGWAALFNAARTLLGQSADNTSITWATSTLQTFTLGTPYVVPSDGWYFLGVCVVASTMPTIICVDPGLRVAIAAPSMGGLSSVGLTTTAPSLADNPLAPGAVLVYGYVS